MVLFEHLWVATTTWCLWLTVASLFCLQLSCNLRFGLLCGALAKVSAHATAACLMIVVQPRGYFVDSPQPPPACSGYGDDRGVNRGLCHRLFFRVTCEFDACFSIAVFFARCCCFSVMLCLCYCCILCLSGCTQITVLYLLQHIHVSLSTVGLSSML